jgi:arsenate reductase
VGVAEMSNRVLVLCTGNSCRSIIGENLVTHLSKGELEGVSAGSTPTGEVNPNAVAVLKKHGVAVNAPRSKSWDEFTGEDFRFVITVCDAAINEVCPMFSGGFEKLHWSIPDPADATGDDIEPAFEAAYQLLKRKIETELLTKIGV